MRRYITATILILLIIPFVHAQAVCGNGIIEAPEECDDGNTLNGDGCSEECLNEKESAYVLFDLAMAHNMLFSKVQDLLHIIKDLLFQLEQKTIEIQLTNYNCDQQPVSFWIPANLDPYGKLNEIDAMIDLTINGLQNGLALNPDGFGIPGPDIAGAQTLLTEAEECLNPPEFEFRQAFECKCLAYRTELLGLTDTTVTCNDPCGP